MKSLKCPICPYRDLDMNPPLCVKDIKFVRCGYKMRGKPQQNRSAKSMKYHRIVKKEQFYNLTDNMKWIDMEMDIKPL